MWLANALGVGVEEEFEEVDEITVTRESLVAFYSAQDPSKVANVDQVLDSFGHGTELVKALKEKYGASPKFERREGTDAAEAIGDDVCAEDESPHESALEANIRELNAKFVATVQRLQSEEAKSANLEAALQEAQARETALPSGQSISTNNDSEAVQQELAALRAAHSEAEASSAALAEQLEAAQAEAATHKAAAESGGDTAAELSTVQQELAALRAAHSEAEASSAALAEQLEAAQAEKEQEVGSWKQRAEKMRDAAKEKVEKLKEAKKQLASVQEELASRSFGGSADEETAAKGFSIGGLLAQNARLLASLKALEFELMHARGGSAADQLSNDGKIAEVWSRVLSLDLQLDS